MEITAGKCIKTSKRFGTMSVLLIALFFLLVTVGTFIFVGVIPGAITIGQFSGKFVIDITPHGLTLNDPIVNVFRFIFLTIIYIIVFSIVVMFMTWLKPRLMGEGEKMTWRAAFRKTWTEFFKNNNRRWEYLFGAAICTSIGALTHLGPGLLVSQNDWARLMHGSHAVLKPEGSWRWWWAAGAYWLLLIIYSPIAISDEFSGAIKHAIKYLHNRLEKIHLAGQTKTSPQGSVPTQSTVANQPGVADTQQTAPLPAPSDESTTVFGALHNLWKKDYVRYITADLVFDSVGELLRDYFQRRRR